MKRYFTILFLLAFTNATFSQTATVSGTITNERGETLVGASILIKETYLGAYSNINGTYSLKGLKHGIYTFEISYLGYKNLLITKNITENTTLNAKLKPAAKVMEDVVVKALRAQDNTPVAKTNISKRDIEQTNVTQDITYQLEMSPSVVASSENGTGIGATSMRIRGTDMSRINITINGIPLNDSESQGVFWTNMPDFASSVDNVQIQRGVGTSTNGAASFGASINFQTLGISEKPFAQASASVGSFGTFKENLIAGTGIIDSCFSATLRLSKLDSKGWIERGFSDHMSLHGTASFFTKKDLLTLNVLAGKQQTGITWWGVPDYMIDTDRRFNPAGEYVDDNDETQFYDGETDNYWQRHYLLNYTRKINKHSNLVIGTHFTRGKGYYEEYKALDDFAGYGIPNINLDDTVANIRDKEYIFPDSTIASSDIIRQKWLDNYFYGLTANYQYKKGRFDFSAGGAANIYKGDHFGLVKWVKFNPELPKDYEWYRNYGEKIDASAFAKLQYQITSELSAYGDLQYRYISYFMEGPDDDLVNVDQEHKWNFLNPKVGLFYKIDANNSAFASFAIANREPTRSDLKEASKDGGKVFPKAETLFDYELGYQYNNQKFALGANLFYMQYNNQLVNTGELNDVGYTIMTNVKDSYRTGVELSLAYKPVPVFEWRINATFSENKIKDYVEYAWWDDEFVATPMGKTDISFSPNIVASNSFMFFPDKTISFGFISKHVGKQYLDNTSNEVRKLDAYTVHNFNISYKRSFGTLKLLHVQFLVNNILDREYISNGYGGNWYEGGEEKSWIYYYPQAGINYMLKVSLGF